MAQQVTPSVTAAAVNQSYQDETVGQVAALQVQERYGKERAKRLRPEGVSQYIDLSTSTKFKHYAEDPWLDPAHPFSDAAQRFGGSKCKVLILGAGFGGLLHAVHLVETGMAASDIRLVDTAGGFGGTWYWNRYPGLMCDVESYIYLPLLEETGYMPKHRYSYGPEIRAYVDLIADKWNLRSHAILQTQVKEVTWDDSGKEWIVDLCETRKGEQPIKFQVSSKFVISASGVLSTPQLPALPGIDIFKGHSFHTSRWNYECTGGSPTDPSLVNLKDKRVAIIGTGATAIQAVPHLARWAQYLYVFQRTPSAVDERGQKPTDPQWWAEMTKEHGWHRNRNLNFNKHMCNILGPEEDNMVDDAWSKCSSYSALTGSPTAELNPEGIPAYIGKLYAMDFPRMERVRARVDQIVKDKATAEKLKAWYPSWCKRPCFHDDYLPVFNQPNVTLVDTDGQGVDGLSADGVLYQGQEYKVDILIFSTGYLSPSVGNIASKAHLTVKGRQGKTMDEIWADGISTLHGVICRDFPNFFFPGPPQTGVGANYSFALDQLSRHTTYMIAQGMKNAGSEEVIIEPTEEAVQAWSTQVLMRAAAFAGVSNCTPSYLNREGEMDRVTSAADQIKAGRGAIWGQGIESYLEVLGDWRAKGDLQGLEVTVV